MAEAGTLNSSANENAVNESMPVKVFMNFIQLNKRLWRQLQK